MCMIKDSTVFLGSLAFFGVAYVAAKKVVPSLIPCADAKALRQQRAWYLTTISSVCASLLGVAFLGRVVVHGFGAEFRRDDTAMDRAFALFFVAYCVGDLVAGKIEYAEQIDEAPYMLEPLVKGFSEQESATVRLELLTVALKIFMRSSLMGFLGLRVCQNS